MQSLFKPGAKINQDHKHKYIHILAYAASVVEMWKKVKFSPGHNVFFSPCSLTVLNKCMVINLVTLKWLGLFILMRNVSGFIGKFLEEKLSVT